MIEAFQIGVSLAVDTDEAHAALAGFGRQLSSVDQSIAQTHRRISEMRAALSMPDDNSGGDRLSELSHSLSRREARSQAGLADLEGGRSLIDQATAHDAGTGRGSSEEVGRGRRQPDIRPHSDATDANDLRSLLDVMGAADKADVVRELPWAGRSDDGTAAPEALSTWHEDFATRHAFAPTREGDAAPASSVGAFDLSSLLPRLGETLEELGSAATSSNGSVGDATIPNAVTMQAWPFDRNTAEAVTQPGAVTERVKPPEVPAPTVLLASSVLPAPGPEEFWQARLPGDSGSKDQVVADPSWPRVANRSAEQDPVLMVPGQGLEAALTGAFAWLGSSSGRTIAPATVMGDATKRGGDDRSEMLSRDSASTIGEAEAGASWRYHAVASDARRSSAGEEGASLAVPPALPFGLPLLPPALWELGEGDKQPMPPSFPRLGDGFIGMTPNDTEMAVKRDRAAPLPPEFASKESPSSRGGEEMTGREKGFQTGAVDDRGDSAGDRPIVVHTNVQIDGDVVARAVTHRMVGALNGPLAGSGGFDPRRSYTPVES